MICCDLGGYTPKKRAAALRQKNATALSSIQMQNSLNRLFCQDDKVIICLKRQ